MPPKRVCVVGAGVSGLVTVKECLEVGLVPVCYELGSETGGTWHRKSDPSTSHTPVIYDSLVTNTPKNCTAFSDFPFPEEQTPFIGWRAYTQYLEDYVDHFSLRKHISLNTKVVKIRRAKDFSTTGRWVVYSLGVKPNDKTSRDQSKEEDLANCKEEVFDAVFVCSGYFRLPAYPKIEGMDKFKGQCVHSYHYKNAKEFEGKNVLVIGNSLSAIDIATDLAGKVDQLHLAIGRGTWLQPRVTKGGVPLLEVFSRQLIYSCHSEAKINKMCMEMSNSLIDHDKCKIRPPAPPMISPISLSEIMPLHIMTGAVKLRGRVTSLEDHVVHFEDGTRLDNVDAIVYCTGYRPLLEFLEEDIIQENDRLDLYYMIYPLDRAHHTLAFIGMCGVDTSLSFVAEIQARYAVQVTVGQLQLPSQAVMRQNAQLINDMNFRRRGSYAYYLPGFFLSENLAQELGVYPKFWKVFARDPKLAWRLWYGPIYCSHYRLLGPGSNWESARQQSHRAFEMKGVCPSVQRELKAMETEGAGVVGILKRLVTLGVCGAVCGGLVVGGLHLARR